MKKLVVLLMVGTLAFGMTACGNGDEDTNQSVEQTNQAGTEETQTDEIQTEENQTQDTGSVVENTDEVTQGTEEGTGTEDVASNWSEEMSGIRQAVVDTLGENYWPNMPMDAEMMEATFGITADMYDDYLAEMPMIGTHVDTLLIVKAKEDKVEEVEAAMNAYRDAKVEDTAQYPMNLGKIQASRIQRFGNYVCFVQLGGEYLAEEGIRTEEDSLTQCQEQNELALEVIGKNLPQ